MAPRLLTSPQAAERLGLPVQALYKLRDADEGLAITQTGLQVGYQVEDIAAYERREMLALVEQVLATARPLPLIRAMAQLLRSPPPEEGLPAPVPNPRPSSKLLTSATPATPATPPPKTPAVSPPPPQKPAPATPVTPATSAWFLVRSKPRQESVALTHLARQGYESYLPLFATEKLVRRKSTVVQEPMFARYLFVRLDTSGHERGQGQSWSPIRSTVGVSELVSFGSRPARVDDALIATLREREIAQQGTPTTLFAHGDSVRITEGAFAGLEAIYQMNDAEGRAMVLLDLLSKPVAMTIDAASLRKVG
ncbi:transcription/translation regulatory transformer protein RfaH [Tepidicella baoligensis]|uniref:transcription/translation regulatory transformer protein RfaH n=1 Tax=Tepidicella baoligensis TaxID=2707016 RepID=UPI001C5C9E4F|nr:transcription/translation regulatory transformer protein RfaH [Tepidicella baoligensis]